MQKQNLKCFTSTEKKTSVKRLKIWALFLFLVDLFLEKLCDLQGDKGVGGGVGGHRVKILAQAFNSCQDEQQKDT